MKKQKWFYPLQEKAKKYLRENFAHRTCISQGVSKNVTSEVFHTIDKNKEVSFIQATYSRTNNAVIIYKLETMAILYEA